MYVLHTTLHNSILRDRPSHVRALLPAVRFGFYIWREDTVQNGPSHGLKQRTILTIPRVLQDISKTASGINARPPVCNLAIAVSLAA